MWLDDFPLSQAPGMPQDDAPRARLERLAKLRAAIARLQDAPRADEPGAGLARSCEPSE